MTGWIETEPETRLEQLCQQYDLAKAEEKKAKEALSAITDAIKLELINAAPGQEDIRLESPHLERPLRLFAVTSRRMDTARIKKEQPAFYEAYSVESTAWQLRAVAQ